MKVLDKLIILSALAVSSMAQLPFFLHRFRPKHQGLLASGSMPYPSSLYSFLNSASSPFSTHGFASSPYSSSASTLSPHFSSPSLFTDFGSSSHFGGSPHKFAASNLDFGTASPFDGGFDQTELIDDYPGFSNAGFGKDLNFAGFQTLKLQSSPLTSYDGGPLLYLQREAEK